MSNNTRKSNFELLRILAMMMVIAHHITIHCFRIQLEDKNLFPLGECFNKAAFFKELLLPQLFMPAGKIANIVFILITGYFLIDKKINIYKQIKKVFSQAIFAVPIVVIGSYLYYRLHSGLFSGIQTFDNLNNDYWFIGYYLGIILVASVFLNPFLNRIEKNEYIVYLTVFFSIFSLAFLRNGISDISANLLTLSVGVFVYSLGGFIRLYNPFRNIRTTMLFLILMIVVSGFCINFYNHTIVNINFAKSNSMKGMYQSLIGYSEYSFLCLLAGVTLFEMFSRIRIGNNRIINGISSSTFMIYLFHDNNFIRNIWREMNWVEMCYYDFGRFVEFYFIWTVILFAMGICIYALYCMFIRLIDNKKVLQLVLYVPDKGEE